MDNERIDALSRYRPADFRVAIQQLNIDELEALAGGLLDGMVDIKAQIGAAQADKHATGTYADPLWFARVRAARRYRGQLLNIAQQRLGELKREQRQLDHEEQERSEFSFPRRFIAVAKEQLPAHIFDAIMAAAHDG